jgi:hypothetical protein
MFNHLQLQDAELYVMTLMRCRDWDLVVTGSNPLKIGVFVALDLRDSISRPIPISSVAGGDDTTRPRRQGGFQHVFAPRGEIGPQWWTLTSMGISTPSFTPPPGEYTLLFRRTKGWSWLQGRSWPPGVKLALRVEFNHQRKVGLQGRSWPLGVMTLCIPLRSSKWVHSYLGVNEGVNSF